MKKILTLAIALLVTGCDDCLSPRTHYYDGWTNPDANWFQYTHCTNCNRVRCRQVKAEAE